jgi:four helix bundle protein
MAEDLCDRSFRFAVRIVKLCRELERHRGVEQTLSRQLLRSGTSIGANIEEGQAGHSRADFLAKYGIARKEARETHYWLRLLVASDLLPEKRLTDLITESDELIAILTTIVKKGKEAKR